MFPVIWAWNSSSFCAAKSLIKFEHSEGSFKVWLWGSKGVFNRVWQWFRIPNVIPEVLGKNV